MLENPFFDLKSPKSLDCNAFAFANIAPPEFLVADGAAALSALSALTVAAVARIVPHLRERPRAWIVGGGGARNRTLMKVLAEKIAPATVETAEAARFSADTLEAQAFAFLAARSMRCLPLTFPTTSGASRPMQGGVVARP